MKVGTRSILYGAHAFWLHPWFVALAWWKLYGFPRDLRLWVAFFVHDLGYWGCPNMDGAEGELHPEWGAGVMARLFGPGWGTFTLHHSRFYSKAAGVRPSRLCMADKLAVALEPWWLYLPRVIATGEINEYMALARDKSAKYGSERRRKKDFESRREWAERMQSYCRDWALEHRDGRPDTWTPDQREARDDSGVWK